MPEDLISLIIPVFNGKKHLNTCFGSIENQDYKNLEIIFIDNNLTIKILKLYLLIIIQLMVLMIFLRIIV